MSQNKGFRHYRNMATPGQAHVTSNKGGVTLAFESPKHINDLTAEDRVQIAFSFCSADDNFERSSGRTMAAERLATSDLTVPGDDFQRLLHVTLARDLLAHSAMPGLDQEQAADFRSRVKRSVGRSRNY